MKFITMNVLPALLVFSVAPAGFAGEPVPSFAVDVRGKAVVIAHRGASQELPEHTLAAYQLAMEQGAELIEPDLHLTADGVLIALHDTTLNRTTNIADLPEFAARGRVDDKGRTIWRPHDFTLIELKQLAIRPGKRPGARAVEGPLRIPTLEEVVLLVRAYQRSSGRTVGLVPEFKQRGLADAFVAFVQFHELAHPERGLPVYIQSFSLADLKAIRGRVPFPAALLGSDFPPQENWDELRTHVDAFAPNKKAVLAADSPRRIAAAHAAGFSVFAYTFADDSYDAKRFSRADEELRLAFENGVDAIFTDSPASALRTRSAWRAGAVPDPKTNLPVRSPTHP